MIPFRFSPTASKEKPVSKTTELLEKADSDEELTREEKDKIARILYGLFGSRSWSYRWMGWMWPMCEAKQMREILVQDDLDDSRYRKHWAPDKTSLRNNLIAGHRREMFYVERNNDPKAF